jgi:hypothetical protein
MLGRISVLGLATVFLATGLSGSGTALPIAPLSKAQVGEVSNVIEVAQQKGNKGGGHPKASNKGKPSAVKHKASSHKSAKVTKVNKTVVKRNVTVHRTVVVRPYRAWVHRPYYGVLIGGVALGTVILATSPRIVPIAPDPTLCWFWSDQDQVRGYWDYCNPPL